MSIYNFSVSRLQGSETNLGDFRGKVLLIVNTASQCGFTSQYKGLEELWRTYRDRGLVVLGFPCNQFGNQEPGGSEQIAEFCEVNYGVTFPMFEKILVNGEDAHPLYKYLKEQAPGLLGTQAIKWNFTKFLVDRQGRVVRRFAPKDEPATIAGNIEEVLAQ
jgi:glutathione peroxidase